jgi:hypothetical protein
MAALFISLGHGVLVFLTIGFVEYDEKNCATLCAEQSIFI